MAQLHDACRKGVVGAEWKPPLHGATRGSGPALGCHESFPLLAHGLVLAAGRGVAQVVLVGVVGALEALSLCTGRHWRQAVLRTAALWLHGAHHAVVIGPILVAAQVTRDR